MKKPRKWHEVYPQGTREGEDEQVFFIALSRDKKYTWKSVSALAHETGLTKRRVEEIIAKYEPTGMLLNNPRNDDQWGYWERVPEALPTEQKTISAHDRERRLNDSLQRGE